MLRKGEHMIFDYLCGVKILLASDNHLDIEFTSKLNLNQRLKM